MLEESPRVSSWIANAYAGKLPLGRVFWLGFALPFIPLLAGIGMYIGARLQIGAALTAFALLVVYAWWLVVSLWRCAPNTARPLYRRLARILAVVIILMLFTAATQY